MPDLRWQDTPEATYYMDEHYIGSSIYQQYVEWIDALRKRVIGDFRHQCYGSDIHQLMNHWGVTLYCCPP